MGNWDSYDVEGVRADLGRVADALERIATALESRPPTGLGTTSPGGFTLSACIPCGGAGRFDGKVCDLCKGAGALWMKP